MSRHYRYGGYEYRRDRVNYMLKKQYPMLNWKDRHKIAHYVAKDKRVTEAFKVGMQVADIAALVIKIAWPIVKKALLA